MKKPVTAYDTMKAACAGMGVPMTMLKAAKEAGCPAFRGNRVVVAEYQRWVKENPVDDTAEQGKEEWQIQKLKKECRRLDLQYETELGELVARGTLKDAMASALQPIIATLERHLDKSAFNALCRDMKDALAVIANPAGERVAPEEET